LTKKQQQILEIIQDNPKMSRLELSKDLGINPSAVQKHIEKLKEKGLLRRIGPDKGGYWEVLR
jgi:ATP-dependent DNA helicase RecG